jgi:lipoprotein NlpD
VNAGRKSRRSGGASAAVLLCASLLCAAQLAGCVSQSTSVPVSRREARAAVHVVQAGETLSRIAWLHRVDGAELAAWNGITNPNALRVGQRLRLVPPRGYVALPRVAPPRSEPSTARQPPPTPTRAATEVPPRAQPPRQNAPSPRAATPPARASAPASRQGAPPVAAVPPRWSWPTDGRVVANFGSDIASGIAIGGREGQPVRTAADGRVVYAGGGLIGYGQLVIIKHDEMFLSATPSCSSRRAKTSSAVRRSR